MWTYKFKKLNAICDINFGCQLVGLQYHHKNSLLGASVRDLQVGLTGMGRHTLIWATPFHRSGSCAACPGKRWTPALISLLPECGCNVTSCLKPLPWWTAPSNCEGNKPFHPWVALFGYVVMTRRRVTNIDTKMGELVITRLWKTKMKGILKEESDVIHA